MTSPEPPRRRSLTSRRLRRLAAITALVVGAGLVGFNTTQASAQSSGRLDVDPIADQVDPAVATITTTISGGRGQAAGTGIVITESGEVVTNNHVIENASSIRVRIGGAGRTHSAEVLGYNVREDIALLKVNGVSNLKTVATDSSVSVGEPVVAFGNGGGRGGTPDATSGSITAVGESITVGDLGGGAHRLRNLIRVNAPLEPGDSGGPLVDADGEVIGVNTAASAGGFRLGSGSRTGFAIPIETALSIADQIESGQGSGDTHVGERAYLGVSIRSGAGAEVVDVQSGSAAEDAGIGPEDVITKVAGKSIDSIDDIASALTPHHPGDKIEVGWTDASGDDHTARVTLGSGPSD
jgi:S1-C subfamily serine protease